MKESVLKTDKCKYCNNTFPKRLYNQEYCSKLCRYRWWGVKVGNKDTVVECKICGKKQVRGMGNFKTCSVECSKENRRRLKSTNYKNEHTDFENKVKYAREYYQENKLKILKAASDYYRLNGHKKIHKKVCLVCKVEYLSERKSKGNDFCSSKCLGTWFKYTRSGKDSPFWKGGVTPLQNKARRLDVVRKWKVNVLKRDLFKCQKCLERSPQLAVHHIVNFSSIINDNDKLGDVNNGVTLCSCCHRLFHKRYGKKNNNIKQLNEFLGIYV